MISVIHSEKCLDSIDSRSGLSARNSKGSHCEYEKTQTSTESGNEPIEIDVTTQNEFAHETPLAVMMDTNRPILSNELISLSIYKRK